ncbi:hypothetical protein WJX81_001657 [Elliptochloris bilobata]|uniref:RRM domain-containing protein n=1 Tax=Elliptochloris bilobata TaxID=381761 RepID=A0AAW1S8M8_9CHLO
MADIPPNQTVYVNNLPDKIKKEELKKCLYAIFSQFGKIVDIVAMKTYRLRGQAWIVFADVSASTTALRSMQGFPFFEKPMRLSFAKTKSDAVAKVDGSYVERSAKERQKKNAVEREKLMNRSKTKGAAPAGGAAAQAGVGATGEAPPHNILFVENLPEATTSNMLSLLFNQYPGYKEVRMVEARPGIAFVEFQNEAQAAVAMSGLQLFQITPVKAMKISYAKQ